MIRKRMPNHALFSTIRENGLAFKYRTRLRVSVLRAQKYNNIRRSCGDEFVTTIDWQLTSKWQIRTVTNFILERRISR